MAAGSSESSESLELAFAVEIPPKRAALALAFFFSALVYSGTALALEAVLVVEAELRLLFPP